MEFFRRLRFVWAIACLLSAALCAVLTFSGPGAVPALPWWLGASLAGAMGFYMGSWAARLTVLWVGTVGGLLMGSAAQVGYGIVGNQVAAGIVGGWVVAAVVVWLGRGLGRSA